MRQLIYCFLLLEWLFSTHHFLSEKKISASLVGDYTTKRRVIGFANVRRPTVASVCYYYIAEFTD